MYPKLYIKILYNNKPVFNHIEVNKQYELEIYIQHDETTFTLIPSSNTSCIIRSTTFNVQYYTDNEKRYLFTKQIGNYDFTIEYNNITYTDTLYIYEYTPFFPKLLLVPYYYDVANNTTIEQPKFLDINEQYYFNFYILFNNNIKYKIPYSDIINERFQCIIVDKNVSYVKNSNYEYVVHIKEPGSCQCNLYYDYCGRKLYTITEIVVYEPFLRNNYLKYLLPRFDATNIQKNTKVKVLFDTLMELLDITYAYMEDLKSINNAYEVKAKYLDNFGASRGFIKSNVYEGKEVEWIYEKLYRELLINLLDLLQIRGTKLAYELFFGALGYDIQITEFWFDVDGNLIEIDPNNELNSTFYKYRLDGTPLEDIQKAHIDPRSKCSSTNSYNYVSKSKYIRTNITPKTTIPLSLALSNEQQILIQQYLQYLKPNHIEYLQNVISFNITRDLDDEHKDFLTTLLDGNQSQFIHNLFHVYGVYIDDTNTHWQLSPLSAYPEKPDFIPYWVPPIGLLNNIEYFYSGVWDGPPYGYPHSNNFGENGLSRGMCIEHITTLQDSILLGSILSLIDSLTIPHVYDSIYKYDATEIITTQDPNFPNKNDYIPSYKLQYDIGPAIYDGAFTTINTIDFYNHYTTLRTTYTESHTIQQLSAMYHISPQQCYNILFSLQQQ